MDIERITMREGKEEMPLHLMSTSKDYYLLVEVLIKVWLCNGGEGKGIKRRERLEESS